MTMIENRIKYSLLFLMIVLAGCNTAFLHPVKPQGARLGAWSDMHDELSNLPQPREKIVAAVYQFRDQTGQYKPSETGASWSTAVTQGATSILLQSLEESGWFVPIEREGLSNLLNERRIIRSSREQYEGGNAQGQSLLPPLLFGGITLEGGIISYESNIMTGGAGLRYFGAGASGEYRENKVTIYLRAVSTSTGRILKTVHTSKTILSQKVSAGLFRFVSLKRILEAETGYTFNEPSHMAVQEAIDKAVYALVVEGIIDGLWGVENPEDNEHPAIANYVRERDMNYNTDYLGAFFTDELRANMSLGADVAAAMYDGDYPNALVMPAAEVSLGFLQHRPMSVTARFGAGRVEALDIFHANYAHTGLDFRYRLFNQYMQGSPYVQASGGVLYHTQGSSVEGNLSFDENLIPYAGLELGYEWLLTDRAGLSLSFSNRQLLSDDIDGMVHGRYNDRIWSANLGFRWYFNVLRR